MKTNFNFKSSPCTSKEQSERLLLLGLKNETADMKYPCTREYYGGVLTEGTSSLPIIIDTEEDDITEYDIPAWSLHRLLSMLPDDAPKIYWILDGASITIEFEDDDTNFFYHKGDIYKGVVDCIEWLIKEGYFNKEYLENGNC